MPGSALRGLFAVVGSALILAACSSPDDTSAPPEPPKPLGSSVHIQRSDSGMLSGGGGFEGTVTVQSPPKVYEVTSTGNQVLAFYVVVKATKGDLPTEHWQLETENAMVVQRSTPDGEGMNEKPPLGAKVSAPREAKGYITFEVQRLWKPVTLDLMQSPALNTDSTGKPLAQWSIDSAGLPSPTPLAPIPSRTGTPEPTP